MEHCGLGAELSPLSSPPYVVRTYEARDWPQVWDLHEQGLRDTAAWHPDPRFNDDLLHIESAYLGEGSHFWVIEEDDRLVGMVAVRRIDAATAELKRMRVARDRRRMGMGQALLELAEDFCRAQRYGRIALNTTDRQWAAQELYRKNGYRQTRERQLGDLMVLYFEKELAS